MPVTPIFNPIRSVPTSVPFTYRDGMTTLELLECLKHNICVLQEQTNRLATNVNENQANTDKALQDVLVKVDDSLAALRAELIDMMSKIDAGSVNHCPVYGDVMPLDDILGHIYDNLRYHGLFWGDYDDMQLTAQEYDALSLKARDYDLKATAVDNCVPGDFPGRSQFPYGKSMPENPVADMAFITQSEADARYVERNPTAANFDSKE